MPKLAHEKTRTHTHTGEGANMLTTDKTNTQETDFGLIVSKHSFPPYFITNHKGPSMLA